MEVRAYHNQDLVSWGEPLLGGEAGSASADDVRSDHDEQLGIRLLLIFVAKRVTEHRELAEAYGTGEGALVVAGQESDDDRRLALVEANRTCELTIGDDGYSIKGLTGQRPNLEIEVKRDARTTIE